MPVEFSWHEIPTDAFHSINKQQMYFCTALYSLRLRDANKEKSVS
jgi:hypothetical protein